MDIKTALEGREVCDKLHSDLGKLRYNPDLHKMLKNINNMVTEVSKLEVICRRTVSQVILERPLKELNDAVTHLQKLILVAQLME
jgi:hypothetical protein